MRQFQNPPLDLWVCVILHHLLSFSFPSCMCVVTMASRGCLSLCPSVRKRLSQILSNSVRLRDAMDIEGCETLFGLN